ncbi:protein SERAC1-like [Dermatophagoides pteronyssinus]|uniref:protein SERAC1-like n=1 Tax=Dermatophagoides pteronyssinus TaxID=6956 RepID=UPI003F66D7D1
MSKYIILISASVSSIYGGFIYLMGGNKSTTTTPDLSPSDEYIDLPEIFSQFNNDYDGGCDQKSYDNNVDFNKTMENWFPKLEFLLKVKNEIDCLKLAQTMNFEQSITAARNIDEKIDLKQFRQPISVDKILLKINNGDDGDDKIQHFETLNDLMIHLLRSTLEEKNSQRQSECANYLTRQTLVLFEHNPYPLWDFSFYHEYNHHHNRRDNLKSSSDEQIQRYKNLYFQTLLQNIMCDENLALQLVENGLLIALLKFLQLFPDSDNIRWISTIISALSVYHPVHQHFYHTGWISILARWLRSQDWHLKLEAGKTLYNMSSIASKSITLCPSIYLLWPLYQHGEKESSLPLDYDVVFIHGLKGGVLRTWRQSDSVRNSTINETEYTELWPHSWLAKDFQNFRILAVHYNSFLSSWNINCSSDEFTIKDRSIELIKELQKAGIGRRPIIWITHSMGGLFVKHMLNYCQQQQQTTDNLSDQQQQHPFIRQTKGIVFYSVPHRGSEMAVWSQNVQRIIYPSNHVLELQKDSPELLELNEKFIQLIRNHQIDCLSFGETKKCTLLKKPIEWRALLVPEESANPGIGKFILLPENHFSICKPKDHNDRSYSELKEFLTEILLKEKLKSSTMATRKSLWQKLAEFSQ